MKQYIYFFSEYVLIRPLYVIHINYYQLNKSTSNIIKLDLNVLNNNIIM